MTRREPPSCQPDDDPVARDCGITPVTFSRPVDGWCHYCGFLATSRDHVVPDSVGGSRCWWNLVPSCDACNLGKADRQACACMFCVRAIALWYLGFRRTGKSWREIKRGKQARRKARERGAA